MSLCVVVAVAAVFLYHYCLYGYISVFFLVIAFEFWLFLFFYVLKRSSYIKSFCCLVVDAVKLCRSRRKFFFRIFRFFLSPNARYALSDFVYAIKKVFLCKCLLYIFFYFFLFVVVVVSAQNSHMMSQLLKHIQLEFGFLFGEDWVVARCCYWCCCCFNVYFSVSWCNSALNC